MNTIFKGVTIHINFAKKGPLVPPSMIEAVKELFSHAVQLDEISFESDWIPGTSRITLKGQLHKDKELI